MEIVLSIIGFLFIAVPLVVLGLFLTAGLHYISWFHLRPCKHCRHHMEYKGLKEDNDNGHYLFHCPKCGAWEQIPREQFLHDIKKADLCNPYKDKM